MKELDACWFSTVKAFFFGVESYRRLSNEVLGNSVFSKQNRQPEGFRKRVIPLFTGLSQEQQERWGGDSSSPAFVVDAEAIAHPKKK